MAFESSSRCVLLVEDHEDLAVAVARILEADGNVVRTAHSIATAVSLAKLHKPDVLMSHGFYMGVETCFELLKALRDANWNGPAILVSGKWLDDELLAKLKMAGFNEMFHKPAALEELVGSISRALEMNFPIAMQHSDESQS